MISATIVGNLGMDAELREVGDTQVLGFLIASNSRRKVEGEWKDEVTWVRVSLFGARAESLSEHLSKGKQVAVRGALSMREYTAKDGEVRTSLECRADDIQLLGSRGDSSSKKGEPPSSKKPVKKNGK